MSALPESKLFGEDATSISYAVCFAPKRASRSFQENTGRFVATPIGFVSDSHCSLSGLAVWQNANGAAIKILNVTKPVHRMRFLSLFILPLASRSSRRIDIFR